MTQAQLAQRLGFRKNSIAMMERGERPVMQATAMAVRYLLLMESKPKRRAKK